MKILKVSDVKPPKSYDIYKDGLTQSLLSSIACPQKFMLSVNGWGKDGKTTTIFGSMFHEMLDKIYTHFKIKNKIAGKKFINKEIMKYIRKLKKEADKKKKPLTLLECQEITRASLIIAPMLIEYIKFHKKDFIDKKWVGLEVKFKNKVDGFCTARGTRDGLFKDKKNNLWLFETKTKGRISPENIILRLNIDFQCLYYIWSTEYETGDEVTGVLYNVIRTPQEKQAKGETTKQFSDRVIKRVKKDPKYYFMRYEQRYTTRQKKEFMLDLKSQLSIAKKLLKGKLRPYKNRFICESPFRCIFLDACASNKLTSEFKCKKDLFDY